MPRAISTALAAHLKGSSHTVCYLLKIMPVRAGVATFGICTLDADVTYDDGTGPLTYRAKRGYTSFDLDTKADMSVGSSEASGLLADYPADGVTAAGVAAGDYDCARFVQYLVNYEDLTQGHVILNAGQVGQVTMLDELTCKLELRSLTQILKQNSIIELTSITCRAQFGDLRCKMPLRWYNATVATVGAEPDRDFTLVNAPGIGAPPGSATGPVSGVPFFTGNGTQATTQLLDTAGDAVRSGFTVTTVYANGTPTTHYTINSSGLVTFNNGSGVTTAPASGVAYTWDGTLTLQPDGFFSPGVVHWLTGANAGRENEVESYVAATGAVTLVIPTQQSIAPGDTFQIRRDCDKSKAMCRDVYSNLLNMRAEPELPRANGTDLQSPSAH
ncbi:MAG TPA: DUF2163 domain-containing protein [Rhodanobacter sp.]|nr:DUF2163 domain-containing protein [Rhodanobacter sp.]